MNDEIIEKLFTLVGKKVKIMLDTGEEIVVFLQWVDDEEHMEIACDLESSNMPEKYEGYYLDRHIFVYPINAVVNAEIVL